METLTINELRTRASEYGNRLNNCTSNKEDFDITLKILNHIYVELIQALKEEGERLEEEIEEME
jgi:NTP pyrophosphatase (non-canonical NTP hydrolase)